MGAPGQSCIIQAVKRFNLTRSRAMNNKTIGRLVGALFLASNATFLLGAFIFVEPLLADPNFLSLITENSSQAVFGALLEIANAVAYVGIAVLVYPIFRPRFPSMAVWYVAFRVIEFVMQSISSLSPMVLVSLSERAVSTGAEGSDALQAAGLLLIEGRAWAFQMVTVSLILGATVFYTMLYKSRLIPRFISVWGWIAAFFVIVTALMDMFGISPGIFEFLGLFMLLNELFLGGWLIVKGFDSVALAANSSN
jgi:hypothetical protein